MDNIIIYKTSTISLLLFYYVAYIFCYFSGLSSSDRPGKLCLLSLSNHGCPELQCKQRHRVTEFNFFSFQISLQNNVPVESLTFHWSYIKLMQLTCNFRVWCHQKAVLLWGLLQRHHKVEILRFSLDIRYQRRSSLNIQVIHIMWILMLCTNLSRACLLSFLYVQIKNICTKGATGISFSTTPKQRRSQYIWAIQPL